jgi:hypothetical protein
LNPSGAPSTSADTSATEREWRFHYANPSRTSETKRAKPSTQAGHWYSQALLRGVPAGSHRLHRRRRPLGGRAPDPRRRADTRAGGRPARAKLVTVLGLMGFLISLTLMILMRFGL